MFRLSRYYSIASLIGIGVIIIVLSVFYRQLAMHTLMQHQTGANTDLAKSFANSIWHEFSDTITLSLAIPAAEISSHPDIKNLHGLTRQRMKDTNIVKVKMYNLNGLTVFSTDARQIGQDKSSNQGFLKAKSGEVASEITFRNEFYAFENTIVDRNLIASYIPIRNEHNGEIEGVFELYSDVTPLVKDMDATQTKIMLGVISSLTILYFFLFLIVRHADRIINRQERERRENEDKIRHQVYHDPLTGLPNRVAFSDRFSEANSRALRHNKTGALMFLDLDRFKLVNDSLGHDAGDQLLQITASRIKKCLRETDYVFRISGDEFIIIQEDMNLPEDAAISARRILKAMKKPITLHDYEIIVSLSIGITTFPREGVDIDALVKEADTAMYRAKEIGVNNYEFYTEEMNTIALKRLTLENDLQRALQENQFLLHYQPKFDTHSKALMGAEALLRWQHPRKGLIPPNDFIPLLEDMGLINSVGSWVIHTACRQIKDWLNCGFDPKRMSVNISAMQFRSQNLVAIVREALELFQLDAAYLELELTESMFVENVEHAIKIMHELKALGITLSIDDFGSGYSSLSYLKQFPIDYLKIDRSFIRDINHNDKDAAITKSISTLAHSLNVQVIAEGVEEEAQLDYLRSLNCQEVQGYLFSKPLCSEEFESSFLRQPTAKASNS